MEDIQHYLCVDVCVSDYRSVWGRPWILLRQASGRWRQRAETETFVFDAVIVSTGHFTKPHLPLKDFPGARNIFICASCEKTLFSLGLSSNRYIALMDIT